MNRLAADVKPATVNREASIIGALFKWAASRNYVAENPTRNLLKPSEKGNARELYLTADETAALVASAPEPFRSVLLCGLHTGMRRGEILWLRWTDVDLDASTIRVSAAASKTREGRTIPLTAPLRALMRLLRTMRPNIANGYVFAPEARTRDQRAWVVTQGLRRTKSAAREGKSIPADKLDGLRFHDIRHTAASLMVAQGVPLFDVGKVLGHKSAQTTLRYAHFAPKAGRAAIDALERALAG